MRSIVVSAALSIRDASYLATIDWLSDPVNAVGAILLVAREIGTQAGPRIELGGLPLQQNRKPREVRLGAGQLLWAPLSDEKTMSVFSRLPVRSSARTTRPISSSMWLTLPA